MRLLNLKISAGILIGMCCLLPLVAEPDSGIDMSLPSTTDRYIKGLSTDEEAQVDRQVDVKEVETTDDSKDTQGDSVPRQSAHDSQSADDDGFLKRAFKDQTFINLLILSALLGVFVLYRIRSGGSRR